MSGEVNYAVIGVGSMGEPILQAMLSYGIAPKNIYFSTATKESSVRIASKYGTTPLSNEEIFEKCDFIVLGIKPQGAREFLAQLAPQMKRECLVVSILAGRKCEFFENILPENIRVVRTMPNTPLQVGRGVIAISGGKRATEQDLALVKNIFSVRATVLEIPEELQDAVAAVSGSGPAYFFAFTESLFNAGVANGIDPNMARELARETFIGAAQLLAESKEEPETLRTKVTSKGGMTAAGLNTFANLNLNQITEAAVTAAKDRSIELSEI
jgi:pyrroline-5-carboxylate reductase